MSEGMYDTERTIIVDNRIVILDKSQEVEVCLYQQNGMSDIELGSTLVKFEKTFPPGNSPRNATESYYKGRPKLIVPCSDNIGQWLLIELKRIGYDLTPSAEDAFTDIDGESEDLLLHPGDRAFHDKEVSKDRIVKAEEQEEDSSEEQVEENEVTAEEAAKRVQEPKETSSEDEVEEFKTNASIEEDPSRMQKILSRDRKKGENYTLTDIEGVGLAKQTTLRDAGVFTEEDLMLLTESEIASIEGIGKEFAHELKQQVGSADFSGDTPTAPSA